MPKNIKVYLFCCDDHKGFSEEIRKRFADTARCNVLSFQTIAEFIEHLNEEKDQNFFKVAILGVHDTKEQIEKIYQLALEIKCIDARTGLILLGTPDRLDEIKKSIRFNIDAYVPKNANAIFRIHNTVKNLICEHRIEMYRMRRNLSLYILLAFVLLSLLMLFVFYFNLPEYF